MLMNNMAAAAPHVTPNVSHDVHLDWYTMVLELIDVADVQLLVESASMRNVPAVLIQVMKNIVTMLLIMQTNVAESRQLGAGFNQSGGDDLQNEKKELEKMNKLKKKLAKDEIEKLLKGKDKDKDKDKDKAAASKSKSSVDLTKMKEWCDLLSVVYTGSANVTDSYNKLTHAIPWYEHCLYVFRRERLISRHVKAWGIQAKIPRDIIVQLDEAMTVFGKIKQHLAVLYKERYAMATKVNFSSLGAANAPRSFTMTAVPGFFIVSAPTTTFVKVDKANEGAISAAFLNRTLEYGARISLDRFMILYNAYFSTILMDSIGDYGGTGVDAYMSENSGNVRFTQLTYTVSTDTFVLAKAPIFEIGFRISTEGSGYPQPVVVFVHTQTMQRPNYGVNRGGPGAAVVGAQARDESATPVNIYEDNSSNPVDTAEMIAQWAQTDGNQIMLNHSFIGNRAI